ncbi:MAG: hypothetical protein ACRDI2_05300 [Chloroflexota bacterium]
MKLSIYAGPPLAQAVDGWENRSGRLNRIAERYLDIVQRECPVLTEAEWCAVCDALNGYWMEGGDNLGVRLMWAEIDDADRLNGLGVKWSIDAQALATRVQEMRVAEQVAVAEVVERFWRQTQYDQDAGTCLKIAGAKLPLSPPLP